MSTQPSYPAHFSLEHAVRPNILALQPYRCARDDYSEGILLDANENAIGHSIVSAGPDDQFDETLALPLHRYPSPVHLPIKERIAALRSLPSAQNVFLGVGSDEVLDLVIRVLVKPGVGERGTDKILITPPTYGMYKVCAQVNDVGVVNVPLRVREDEINGREGGLDGRFSLNVEAVKKAVLKEQRELGNTVKIIFLCSPGNPTGTLIDLEAIKELLEWEEFKGVVLVDEAYIDFVGTAEDSDPDAEVRKRSAASLIDKYSNLIITQTFSKGFGLAGIRCVYSYSIPRHLAYRSQQVGYCDRLARPRSNPLQHESTLQRLRPYRSSRRESTHPRIPRSLVQHHPYPQSQPSIPHLLPPISRQRPAPPRRRSHHRLERRQLCLGAHSRER